MPVLGVERAVREIERAAEATRSRGRRRSAVGTDLPEVPGEVNCGACGNRMASADAFVTDAGPRCVVCFNDAEAAASDTSPWSALRPVAGSTLLLVAVWVPLAPTIGQIDQFTPRSAIGIVVLGMMVVCGCLVVGLQWLRAARDALFPTIHADEGGLGRVLRGGLAGAFALLALTMAVALTVQLVL
ncbi:MAG: hypothetical protein AAF602_19700 [Myxococcota bacterium]